MADERRETKHETTSYFEKKVTERLDFLANGFKTTFTIHYTCTRFISDKLFRLVKKLVIFCRQNAYT